MELTKSNRAGEAKFKAMSIRWRSPLMESSKEASAIEKLTGHAGGGRVRYHGMVTHIAHTIVDNASNRGFYLSRERRQDKTSSITYYA